MRTDSSIFLVNVVIIACLMTTTNLVNSATSLWRDNYPTFTFAMRIIVVALGIGVLPLIYLILTQNSKARIYAFAWFTIVSLYMLFTILIPLFL